MIRKSWLLVMLACVCAVLLAACQAESGGGGGGGGDDGSNNANGNTNLNDNADPGGDTNDNSSEANTNDNVDGGTDGNDNTSANMNDNLADDNGNVNDNTEPPVDGNVNDNTGGGGGGGGGTTDTIVPGSGVAGVVVEETTQSEVETLFGAPDASTPGVYLYVSLGIDVFFNEQTNVVRKLLLVTPYSGTTPGGNGIGSTLAQFRAEFGSDDVLDAAQNFRVWEADGIAARFDSTSSLAVGIQILLPT